MQLGAATRIINHLVLEVESAASNYPLGREISSLLEEEAVAQCVKIVVHFVYPKPGILLPAHMEFDVESIVCKMVIPASPQGHLEGCRGSVKGVLGARAFRFGFSIELSIEKRA